MKFKLIYYGVVANYAEEGNNVISVGPDPNHLPSNKADFLTKDVPGTNNWYNHLDDQGMDRHTVSDIRLPNLNTDKVRAFANQNLQGFDYTVFKGCGYSCVQAASKGLLAGGVLNIPAYHPILLEAQIALIRNSYMSYSLWNNYGR